MDLVGRWSWKEVLDGAAEVKQMIELSSGIVDLIVDARSSTGVPGLVISNLRWLNQSLHPRSGVIALVGMSDTMTTFWGIFLKTYGRFVRQEKYMVAHSIDEARRRILEINRTRV